VEETTEWKRSEEDGYTKSLVKGSMYSKTQKKKKVNLEFEGGEAGKRQEGTQGN